MSEFARCCCWQYVVDVKHPANFWLLVLAIILAALCRVAPDSSYCGDSGMSCRCPAYLRSLQEHS